MPKRGARKERYTIIRPYVILGTLLVILLAVFVSKTAVVQQESKPVTPAKDFPSVTELGYTTYRIQNSGIMPEIYEAVIDPVKVAVGDRQTMTVKVRDNKPVKSVTAEVETDLGIRTYELSLVAGNPLDGVWQSTWTVQDTHSKEYSTKFTATNEAGDSKSVTLTWDDPCSPPPGGDWALDGNCNVNGVNGVDNGNLVVNNPSYTLTIQPGAKFAWNSGKSIVVSGGNIALADGAVVQQTNLWMTDEDADGVPSTTAQVAQDAQPASARRRMQMTTTSSSDCSSNDASTWQNLNGYRDADVDTYTTGSVQSLCSGNSLPSGWRASANGNDCNDADNTKWVNLNGIQDSDNDGYTVGGWIAFCTGGSLPAGYRSSSSGADCYDSNAAAKPGSTTCSGSHRGDGSYDYDCNGVNNDCDAWSKSAPGSSCTGCGGTGGCGVNIVTCINVACSGNWGWYKGTDIHAHKCK